MENRLRFFAWVMVILVVTAWAIMQAKRPPRPGESSVKGNMHAVLLALEEFSEATGGYYPADINTTVGEVLQQLGKSSDDSSSIAGARGRDPVAKGEIASTGYAFLPDNFALPSNRFPGYDAAGPTLATSNVDPPTCPASGYGMVFYVPLEVDGKIAAGFKIYGCSRTYRRGMSAPRLLSLVLTPEHLK